MAWQGRVLGGETGQCHENVCSSSKLVVTFRAFPPIDLCSRRSAFYGRFPLINWTETAERRRGCFPC